MTVEQKVIRAKVGLLELAKQLDNVSKACKVMAGEQVEECYYPRRRSLPRCSAFRGWKTTMTTRLTIFALLLGFSSAARADWRTDPLADALSAGPPAVTSDAKVYGYDKAGKRILLRDGKGAYTCISSGSYSVRIGKPPLPYPDPLCADQNAWAFLEAVWAEPNPLKPQKPYPTAPGLVWMLAGMNVVKGKVAYGKDDKATVATGHDHGAGAKEGETISMTPHLMILPLPIDPKAASLSGTYDANNPLSMWVMAPNSPLQHLHVHFPDAVYKALMSPAAKPAVSAEPPKSTPKK